MIAGGGIGGLAAALSLRRVGVEVRVFERAPLFQEIGAGVSLWPNATRVLKSFGLLEAVREKGEEMTQLDLRRPDGSALSHLRIDRFSTPALCLHRADLHRILRDSLPADVLEANRRLRSFAQDGEGVAVDFLDGGGARAAGLIGADGIRSIVRAQLHGASDPIYHGYRIWRGVAPIVRELVRGHITETWGAGCRFGIMPLGHGRVCWYATHNEPALRADSPEGRKAEVAGLFKDWHDPIPALIEATEPEFIIRGDAHDREPLRTWGMGRVTLLGDAAHPITPNVGQGACLAIEDAACIARQFLASRDVPAAFRAYEAARHRRTARIARQSRRIGRLGQFEHPWVVGTRNALASLLLSFPMASQLNAMYAYEA